MLGLVWGLGLRLQGDLCTYWSYVLATQVSSMCHGVNQSLVENDTQCIGSVCIAL